MPTLRRSLAPALGLLALVFVAPVAHGRVIEIGETVDRPAASCPADPCQAVTRTSGFQVTAGAEGKRGLFRAPRDGRVVAFTIRLGSPSQQQIDFFNGNFGGAAQARLSILKPPERGNVYQLTGQSEVFQLARFFGRETQFPLLRSLTVREGYLVALTTRTWIPAIALGLDRGDAWRSSRPVSDCDAQPPPQSAQERLGASRDYRCLYRGARLTYRATMVTIPSPNRTSAGTR